MGNLIEKAKKFREAIDAAGILLSDEQAIKVKLIYKQWKSLVGTEATNGLKFRYNDDLYKITGETHTFALEWVPGVGTESLYTRIDETHSGSQEDPIPYNGNMELIENLYYSQDGVLYRCTRDTEQPVVHALKDLVGHYVEVV